MTSGHAGYRPRVEQRISLIQARRVTAFVEVYADVFQSTANKMQRYEFFYLCKLLYMFRVDPAPIVRITTLYLQHLVFVKPLLLPAAIVEELEMRSNSSTIVAHSSNVLTNTR